MKSEKKPKNSNNHFNHVQKPQTLYISIILN